MEKRRLTLKRFRTYRVGDFMNRGAIVIGRYATLAEAEHFFAKHECNLLPIVDRLRLVGILTKTDYLKAFCADASSPNLADEDLPNREVQNYMTVRPKTFSPESPLARVLEEMVAARHQSYAVVDGDRFVGLISREDIVRAVRRARDAA